MAAKYKVVSILFSVDYPPPAFRIITDIERYYRRERCVISLKAFSGDLFQCTLCDEDIVARVKAEDTIFINNKPCKYKEVETNITCIEMDIHFWNVNIEEMNRMLRPYGSIMISDIQQTNTRKYFAIIDLRRDLPGRLKSRFGNIDVIELQ